MKGNIVFLLLMGLIFNACEKIELEPKLNGAKEFKYSPLHIAVRLNNLDNVKRLLNDKDLNKKDPYEDTPLLDAVRNNNTQISKLLICNGADINIKDKNNYTPLDIAVRNDNTHLVRILNNKNIPSLCGNTFLKKELALLTDENITFIKDSLSFNFYGESKLSDRFKENLSSFIPRLFNTLEKQKNIIEEIQIKSHTSSMAKNQSTIIGSYIENKKNSTRNANNIHSYLNTLKVNKELLALLKAYGMSSSETIEINGKEDKVKSFRTEIKIILKK